MGDGRRVVTCEGFVDSRYRVIGARCTRAMWANSVLLNNVNSSTHTSSTPSTTNKICDIWDTYSNSKSLQPHRILILSCHEIFASSMLISNKFLSKMMWKVLHVCGHRNVNIQCIWKRGYSKSNFKYCFHSLRIQFLQRAYVNMLSKYVYWFPKGWFSISFTYFKKLDRLFYLYHENIDK